MSDIAENLDSEFDARLEAEAEAASDRIKGGQHWDDWRKVCLGYGVGRAKAMRRAGTNQPLGKTYNRAFADWMDEHKFARAYDKATRNHALWCCENMAKIDVWRLTLGENQREAMNHPTSVKRNFDKTHIDKDRPAKPTETKAQRVERELEQVAAERDKWRTMAERDGSLFDLKKDSIADIVATIRASVTPYRMGELAKALTAEAARMKAEKKHAG